MHRIRMTLHRVTGGVLIVVALSFATAVLENRIIWGYYFVRSTLSSALDGSIKIVGLDAFDAVPETRVLFRLDRREAVSRARKRCQPQTDECLEGEILLKAIRLSPSAPPLATEFLQDVWGRIQTDGWQPRASGRYLQSSQVVTCVLVRFSRGTEQFILAAARTSEVANDRYALIESLFSVNGKAISLIKQTHYYFDVAGVEGLEWPIFWPLNALIMVVVWLIFHGVKRLAIGLLNNAS